MAHDLVIRGGSLVDGSGAAPTTGDVAIDGDRLTQVGGRAGAGREEIDADGLVVSPGFIDPHTHYDAQVCWDPALTPFLLERDHERGDGQLRLRCRSLPPSGSGHHHAHARTRGGHEPGCAALGHRLVLGRPSPNTWMRSPPAAPALNVGGLIGHSAIRYWVLGDAASEREASDAEIQEMRQLVRDAMAAGSLGFSSSQAPTHLGGDGRPVPSRLASDEEIVSLAEVMGEFGRGAFEITAKRLEDVQVSLEAARRSGRPTTLLGQVRRGDREEIRKAREQGVQVIPQTTCRPTLAYFGLDEMGLFDQLPSWAPVAQAGREELPRIFSDPDWRARFREDVTGDYEGMRLFKNDWDQLQVLAGESAETRALVGRSIDRIARDRGTDPLDTFFDLALEDGLKTRFRYLLSTDESRRRTLVDDGYLIGLSDAGAHLTLLADHSYPTYFLGSWIRERQLMPLEQAIPKLTSAPARFFGIPQRGELREGLVRRRRGPGRRQRGRARSRAGPRPPRRRSAPGHALRRHREGDRERAADGRPRGADGCSRRPGDSRSHSVSSDTIVWITGATEGIGSGLARTVPWPGARVINLSRRQHPELESVQFDLIRPETYAAVEESFRRELADFRGQRAIFFHNAFYPGPGSFGFVSEVDQEDYARCIQANAVAPMVLGDMFLRAVQPHYESGLVLMSSAAARHPFIGSANYCAAKAGGRDVGTRREAGAEGARPPKTWLTAVRPGFVLSYGTRLSATIPGEGLSRSGPRWPGRSRAEKDVLLPEEAGRDIWAALPPGERRIGAALRRDGGLPVTRRAGPMPSRRESIRMTPEEIRAYLQEQRRIILVTNGPDGLPHPVPMNYGLDAEGRILITSFRKSQKVRNLERDGRATLLVESGSSYGELKSVIAWCRAEIVDDPDRVQQGMQRINADATLTASLSESMGEQIRQSLAKRVLLRFEPFLRQLGPLQAGRATEACPGGPEASRSVPCALILGSAYPYAARGVDARAAPTRRSEDQLLGLLDRPVEGEAEMPMPGRRRPPGLAEALVEGHTTWSKPVTRRRTLQAPVHQQVDAADEGGAVREQELHRVGDLHHAPLTPERSGVQQGPAWRAGPRTRGRPWGSGSGRARARGS